MAKQYQDDLMRDADRELSDASDVSMIPIVGAGMASGKTGRARQLLGKAASDIIGDVDLPMFSNADYAQYSLAGEYTPESAGYETISEDPRLRQVQMDALQTLVDRASGAADARMQAEQYGAMDEANQLARGREQAIAQSMARKGQSGSGIGAVLAAQAAQQGANRARSGSQDAVLNAALEKLQAQNSLMAGAGNVRGQDFQRAAANSDIVNRFNMFNTNARNEAKRMNLNAAQTLGNANVDLRNKGFDRREGNKQQMFGNSMTRATGRANALQGMSAAAGQSADSQMKANDQGYEQSKDIISGLYGLFGGGGE